jgi:hypothetical protein
LLIAYWRSNGKAFACSTKKRSDMQKLSTLWICAIAMVMTLSSCEIVGGIFKAGFWTAIILIVLVIILILWLVRRMR